MHVRSFGWMTAILIALGGCDGGDANAPGTSTTGTTIPDKTATSSQSPATAPAQSTAKRIVFLGDSLTAGYGLETTEAFPALIERQLKGEGLDIQVVNAGVSGDTTAGGLRRLDWILRQKPAVLVVCLGGNDGMRNVNVADSRENLRQIITRGRDARAKVLLLGMMIPTNYGPEYREQFSAIYPALAQETGVPIVPFALEGVGGIADLNQPDGIHPTAKGHEIIARNVAGRVRELVTNIDP